MKEIANPSSRLALKKLCVSHKPDFVFISERPSLFVDKFPSRFWKNLNLKVFAINNRNNLSPNLCCACAVNLEPTIIANSNQHISFSVLIEGQIVGISTIYASTQIE